MWEGSKWEGFPFISLSEWFIKLPTVSEQEIDVCIMNKQNGMDMILIVKILSLQINFAINF